MKLRSAGRPSRPLALLLVMAAAATSCGGSEPVEQTSPTENVAGEGAEAPSPAPTSAATEEGPFDDVVVTVAFPPGHPGGTPLWIGEPLGFFEEERLNVEVVTLPGRTAEAASLVVAGRADMVIGQPDTIVVPVGKGEDQGLQWVFTPYQRPLFVIAVKADSEITSAAELEGTTVGMPSLGPPNETFMQANVRAEGGDETTIEPVAINGPAALEALSRGDIAAFVSPRPNIAVPAQATGVEVRYLPLPPEVEQGFAAGFLIREESTAAERDAYARYLRAYTKSAIFAKENPEAAIRLNWELYPASQPSNQSEEESLEEQLAVLEALADEWRPAADGQWGFISQERWEAFVGSLGFSEEIPDVTRLYDYSLLDEVNAFDEEAVRQFASGYGG